MLRYSLLTWVDLHYVEGFVYEVLTWVELHHVEGFVYDVLTWVELHHVEGFVYDVLTWVELHHVEGFVYDVDWMCLKILFIYSQVHEHKRLKNRTKTKPRGTTICDVRPPAI